LSTFLIFLINARKEIEMMEVEVNDEPDETNNLPDPWFAIRPHIDPPYNGRALVVNKDDVRIFRLKTEVVESK
jgi:hypothetical protein